MSNKVIVVYDDWGRMGNRMFTYCFGKILSSKKQIELCCQSLPNFPYTENNINIKPINNPIFTKSFGNHYTNVNLLLDHKGDIIVNSYLQKAIYYIPYREQIREWLFLSTINFKKPDDDELVIHIRETDYKDLGLMIDENYYIKTIKLLGYSKNTIVTDNCDAPIIQKLIQECNCKVLSTKYVDKFSPINDDHIMQDFIYMLCSKHLLIAHSTFSWWPAFLGKQLKTYCPKINQNSMWKQNPQQDEINLILPEFINI